MRLVRLRPINMRPVNVFVKPVNTRYCGSLLGQSQDIDVWGRQVGGHDRPPAMHREGCSAGLFSSRKKAGRTGLSHAEQPRCHLEVFKNPWKTAGHPLSDVGDTTPYSMDSARRYPAVHSTTAWRQI